MPRQNFEGVPLFKSKNQYNIGLTIPGNCLSKSGGFHTDFMKSGGFHPWNPYEIWQILPEIWQISPMKSVWNPPDFTWNPPDFMKSVWNLSDFTWNPYEIRRISWNVSFCVMIKYRSFFRKTNYWCCTWRGLRLWANESMTLNILSHFCPSNVFIQIWQNVTQ